MTMKPFEIQGAELVLGGVQLQAGTTGVVIPGITQAANFRVEEIEDTGDQTATFAQDSEVVVIDFVQFNVLANGNSGNYADFTATTDSEGYIDDIEVNGQGTYTSQEASDNARNDMYAYNGSGNASDVPFVPEDWIQIPFRPKMRAGEIENIGGGGASALEQLEDVDLSDPQDGQALVWDSNDEVWKNQTVSGGSTNTGDVVFEGPVLYVGGTGFLNLDNPDNQLEIGTNGPYSVKLSIDEGTTSWTFAADGGITFPDGSTQTTAYTGQTNGSGELYIMANIDGNIVTSTDGITWSDPINSGMPNINRVEVHNGVIVYISGAVEGVPNNPGLYYSTTIGTTTLCAGTDTFNDSPVYWNNVHYFTNTNKWVAVGYIAGGNSQFPILAHSDNGISWTLVPVDNTFYNSFNPENRDWQLTDIAYINETSQYVITSYINFAEAYGGIFVTQDITVPLDGNVHVPIQQDFWQVASWTVTGYGGPPGYMILTPWVDEPGSSSPWFGYGTSVEGYSLDTDWWTPAVINQLGYLPYITEVAYDNNDFIAVTEDGQVITPSFSMGPGPSFVVSIPLPYTTTDFSITNANPAVLTYNGPDSLVDNEKMVVTDSGEYNGTYYWKSSDGVLYTDRELTTALDASGFAAFTSGGTITLSHGQYFDAAGTSLNYYYIGNDDEQVFRSANGINWTLQTDVDGMYFNDFAYGTFGSITVVNTGDITFDGVDIIGDGSMRLIPNTNSEFVSSGQYIQIYPTINQDAPHIHIAAGEGGDLLIGTDNSYVDVNHDGTVKVKADGGKQWQFDTAGKLHLPEGGDIVDSTGTSVLGASGSSGFTIARVAGQDDILAEESGNTLELVAGEGVTLTTNTSDGTITISAASNATPQYGYFNELVHTGSSNEVDGEAVAMDSEGNSYVSYSYYDDNESRNYGGVAKFSNTGEKLWAVDIASQNSDAGYPRIKSLEYVTYDGQPALIAFGDYYDNNSNKDAAFIYYINPTDGSVGESSIDSELSSLGGMSIRDGVAGNDDNNSYVVLVGETYDQALTKTLIPQAGSTTDKVYFSWADVNASGVGNGEQLVFNDGGSTYGITMNTSYVTASPDGLSDGGISLSISSTEAGNYVIARVNGWGPDQYGWAVPQTLRVLGSNLGGVDGVNDMTFDFDTNVFANNSDNINAAVSNIQGTSISSVICPAWGGKDWSTEIGNALNFNYQLNNQAYITRIGTTASWTKNLGASNYDRLNSVVVDGDGNVYAVGYCWTNSRGSLVVKYDIDGTQQWAVYIDPSNNTGNELMSVDLVSDGNLIIVDEEGIVTKVNSSDGSIMWQVQTDSGPSWDGNFRGTATPDGDYIITNYEDDDYTQYVMRISGNDGSSVWDKRITRTYGGDQGEMYAQDDFNAQYIDCNATNLTIAGSTEPGSGNRVGIAYSFPIDGENTDGTYGQYVISSESLNWNTLSSTSVAAVVPDTAIDVTVNSISPTSSTSLVSPNQTSIGGEPVVEPTVITWTSPNDNIWRVETYNGGAAVTYNGGDDYSANWFDISNHTSGSNDFRGAIIQYHAFIQNRGTIIGTIHLSNDSTQQNATHTEHLSGSSDLQYATLWDCNYNRGQLYFKMTNNQTWDAMVQWTSTVFYGQENND